MTTQDHPGSVDLYRDSAVPLYVQIAEALGRQIAEGRLRPGARLPSEGELMRRFGVSRITVRGALASLAKAGSVEARQGKGTFVAAKVVQHGLDRLTGFYDAIVSQGLQPERELLDFRAATPAETRGTPFAGASPPAWMLRRLYVLDGKPFAIVHGLLLPQAARLSQRAAASQTIYQMLAALRIDVERADVAIRARAPRIDVSRALALPPRRHVLVMARTSYAAGGRLLEHTHFHIAPDAYEFCLSVVGPVATEGGIRRVDARAHDRPSATAIAE